MRASFAAVCFVLGCAPLSGIDRYDVVDNACSDDAVPDGTGGCRTIGVSACVSGFAPDGRGGCTVDAASLACGRGLLALPVGGGCHAPPPVTSPCGDGSGYATIDSSTKNVQYVASSKIGDHHDGTIGFPFGTLQDGIDAAIASDGDAIVLVHSGVYRENVVVDAGELGARRLRVLGSCARTAADDHGVEVNGADPHWPTVSVVGGAPGAAVELDSIAITTKPSDAPLDAVGLRAEATDVELRGVWVHDTASRGVEVTGGSLHLEDTLIEGARAVGVNAKDAALALSRVEIRDVSGGLGDEDEAGVLVVSTTAAGADAVVDASLIARVGGAGLLARGVRLVVQDTAILAIAPRTKGLLGRGVHVAPSVGVSPAAGTLELRSSIVDGARDAGVFARGASLLVEDTVIRSVAPRAADDCFGFGIWTQAEPGSSATTRVARSLVDGSHGAGLRADGTDTVVEHVILRATSPAGAGCGDGAGDGIVARVASAGPGSITLDESLVSDSARAGIASQATPVALHGSVLACGAADVVASDATTEASLCGCGDDWEICRVAEPAR